MCADRGLRRWFFNRQYGLGFLINVGFHYINFINNRSFILEKITRAPGVTRYSRPEFIGRNVLYADT